MLKINKIRIATRGSKLALWQAEYIGNLLKRNILLLRWNIR